MPWLTPVKGSKEALELVGDQRSDGWNGLRLIFNYFAISNELTP